MKRIFLVPLLIVMQSAFVQARERHEFYRGARCQAMGGACIAVVNDETALIVNPAALGKLRDFYGTILDPELEVNGEFYETNRTNTSLQPFELESVKNALDGNRDKPYHAKLQVFPSFVARNFGIGFLGKYSLDARMSADGSTIDTFYQNDYAFLLGYNLRFFDGRIKLGFNAKLISRIEVNNPALSSTGSLAYNSIASEGVGLSTDVGLILTAPWAFLPTVSAVVRDVGGTKYDKATGVRMTTTTRPETVKQDVDVAAALFPIHTNYVRSSWTVQYNGLLSLSEEDDKAKRMHFGMEFNFGDVFFVRGGYNQRYWTAGVELASEMMQIQISSYGEEVGTMAQPEEDRRYIFKTSWRF